MLSPLEISLQFWTEIPQKRKASRAILDENLTYFFVGSNRWDEMPISADKHNSGSLQAILKSAVCEVYFY